jgi:hypothetical protein
MHMDRERRIEGYERALLREEDAAASATTRESARIHSALAEMYRHEIAKMDTVRRTLQVAFGPR